MLPQLTACVKPATGAAMDLHGHNLRPMRAKDLEDT